jgi:hypothetical protein
VKIAVTKRTLARRLLSLAVCYVVALQAFLAAYGTAFAISRADAFAGFPICHGADGTHAANSDGEKSEKAPCALCAVAAAAGGLLPDPASVVAAPLLVCGSVENSDTGETIAIPPARAGLSRAPPV